MVDLNDPDRLTNQYATEIYTNSEGLSNLLKAWIRGETGIWTSRIYKNLISMDINDNCAVFCTSEGNVNVGFLL